MEEQEAQAENQASTGGEGAETQFKTFETLAALEAVDQIATRCVSELAGVEILKGKSGKIYLLSNKRRIIPKHTLVGGFGAGRKLGFVSPTFQMCFYRTLGLYTMYIFFLV